MENKYIKVANDCELQKEFIKDYNSFIEEFILLGNLVFEEGRSSIEANRKDILNMLDVNIVKLRKVYNFINSLDLLDTEEFEEVDINDIEIPFVFNCVSCNTELKHGDDFNYCKYCLDDYLKEQENNLMS